MLFIHWYYFKITFRITVFKSCTKMHPLVINISRMSVWTSGDNLQQRKSKFCFAWAYDFLTAGLLLLDWQPKSFIK